MGDGSNFKPGQPAYQSAILSSTTVGVKSRGKGNKFGKEAFGSGFRLAGGDSPTTLSDADIPTSLATGKKTNKVPQVRALTLFPYVFYEIRVIHANRRM